MDDITKEAVRAFYRLLKATSAAMADPTGEPSLSNAAYEANRAMAAAGLLDRPQHELFDLVRQQYPDFNPNT